MKKDNKKQNHFELILFFNSVKDYYFVKVSDLILIVIKFIKKAFYSVSNFKINLLGKLIWGRGKISRNIRYYFILSIFTFALLATTVLQDVVARTTETNDSGTFIAPNRAVYLNTVNVATAEGISNLIEPFDHTVEEGESLAQIAQQYGRTVETIKYANNLTSDSIKNGDILRIPSLEGSTLHNVEKGDTLASLSKKYSVPQQTIVDFNYLNKPYTFDEGDILTIPDAKLPQQQRRVVSVNVYDGSAYGIIPTTSNLNEGTGRFVWPFYGVLTQFFHSYHPGIDIAKRTGNIYAADSGTVIRSGWWQGGYGNAVQIDHGNGFVTTYAHMSKILANVDQKVEKGQPIGVVGSTGRSTGPHLHFTIQRNGAYVNPMQYLPSLD